MKIFAIRDESSQKQKDLAYLLYYEQEKRFYIELPENADAWETPLLLDSFVKRGETTVNSYWSKIWVQQRIVPTDRQNSGEILRDKHLKEYDVNVCCTEFISGFHRLFFSCDHSSVNDFYCIRNCFFEGFILCFKLRYQ